ncbi:MAG: zinc metallopeptidase [Rikenellaceae bacterium]|jgi:Zn-dependent membrane protease YugP|nr:zinc metallopeptidase [Rikenellaceae bacterium]MBQ2020189.1 zinc metallopeptidase [Rikenellaceae bacterium]MBQ5371827.1 zinc metallopeptidase [Rikenellaceae bacterium]MBQ5678502.1 zinc metallopeptidase [Rikenellaceae bacterium]MBQ5852667.1 zinc metallopeptidase [Rikenellaceae bacterium]
MPVAGINIEWLLIIVIGVVGMLVQWRLQSVFTKYSHVRTSNGMTGRDVAEKMLRDNGIYDVRVTSTPGHLTDHYNPADKTVNLSESVYNSPSIAAAAVASHECGHAVQHARGYAWLEMRSKLVPLISITSRFSTWVIILGMLTINTFPALFWIGILMIAASALFSIITLPVEYNASARALDWLRSTRTLDATQMEGASISLRWAARTYLVAALSAIATLLYYLGFARNRD